MVCSPSDEKITFTILSVDLPPTILPLVMVQLIGDLLFETAALSAVNVSVSLIRRPILSAVKSSPPVVLF